MTRRITRRELIKGCMAGGLLGATGGPMVRGTSRLHAASPNSEVAVGVIGLGGIDIVGGVGGRGRQLIGSLSSVPGTRVVALCDVDETILGQQVEQFQKRGDHVAAHTDLRRVLDDQNVDAVLIATPNHWHALATVWACQAGKDVYVEKPFSHDIWEGRQMLAAAQAHARMVQVGTQSRSYQFLREAFQAIHGGLIGPIRYVHAIVYRPREGIGQVDGTTPVPASVDYDLWCGPTPVRPLMRKQLHYEWHWFWPTGNGEIGNNGAHTVDIARWALGQNAPPPRAMSIGGRFGFHDCGETPNTQIAVMDYQPAPMICEIRNLRERAGADTIGRFQGINRGVVIQCADGHCIADATSATVYHPNGTPIRQFRAVRNSRDVQTHHLASFVEAVRSRDATQLNAAGVEGHLSGTCCHMANISHRLGQSHNPDEIREVTKGNSELSDSWERCQQYLLDNGVDLDQSQAIVGPWVTLDSQQWRFVGDFADQANELARREYRKPFVVPQLV